MDGIVSPVACIVPAFDETGHLLKSASVPTSPTQLHHASPQLNIGWRDADTAAVWTICSKVAIRSVWFDRLRASHSRAEMM